MHFNIFSSQKIKLLLLSSIFLWMCSCQTQQEKQEDMGESEEVNQSPSLPEARMPQVDTVRLDAEDFVFLPPKLFLPPGKEVMFVLTNKGDNNHSIHFEFPYGDVALGKVVQPGKKDSLTLKIPEEEGTYLFYCPQGQHREKAMRGEIIVEQGQEQQL